jgi:hypothetical protein
MQFGSYRIVVVLKLQIAWGGCTKKTVKEWLEFDGTDLIDSDKEYLEKYTKPFIRMFADKE